MCQRIGDQSFYLFYVFIDSWDFNKFCIKYIVFVIFFFSYELNMINNILIKPYMKQKCV